MQINKKIFKAYDIRGAYPEFLNEEVIYRIGRSFVSYLQSQNEVFDRVVIGRDMRMSSESLSQSIVKGINDQGKNVVNVGLVSTDAFYFACQKFNCPGIMVSASHNPKQDNGCKMIRRVPFGIGEGEGMEELYKLVVKNEFDVAIVGIEEKVDITEEYVEKILSLIDIKKIKPLKVLADTGNGTAGLFIEKIFSKLPVELISMNFKVDGENPVHGWDPLDPENRKDLEKKVVEAGADVGLAFDGDADRFFLIDNNGVMVPGDFMTALLAQYFLARQQDSKAIIYDLRASKAIDDLVKQAGGIAWANRVGHTFIKRRMIKENAIFGGEVTGHYYFKDFYCCDSALATALYVLEMLSIANKKVSEILEPLYSKYFISGEINNEVKDPDAIIKKIAEIYRDGKITYEDGISVGFDNWHFNVRKSNTQPLLRLNLEAESLVMMEEKRDEVLKLVKSL